MLQPQRLNTSRSCDPCVHWPSTKRKAICHFWTTAWPANTILYLPMPRIVFWQAKLPGVESWSTHKCRWIPCMVLAWSSAFSCPVPSIPQHLPAPPSCIDCFLPGICRWHRQRWFVLVVEWITWWGRQISCIGNWGVLAGSLKQRWHDDWLVVLTCLDMFQIFSSLLYLFHPTSLLLVPLLNY